MSEEKKNLVAAFIQFLKDEIAVCKPDDDTAEGLEGNKNKKKLNMSYVFVQCYDVHTVYLYLLHTVFNFFGLNLLFSY